MVQVHVHVHVQVQCVVYTMQFVGCIVLPATTSEDLKVETGKVN